MGRISTGLETTGRNSISNSSVGDVAPRREPSEHGGPTVGDVLRHISAKLSDDGVYQPDWWANGRHWHELLYDLKKDPKAPASLKEEFFEWDAPYPKSVTVKNYLPIVQAYLCSNFEQGRRMMRGAHIKSSLVEIQQAPQEYRDFLDRATELAKQRFRPLQE